MSVTLTWPALGLGSDEALGVTGRLEAMGGGNIADLLSVGEGFSGSKLDVDFDIDTVGNDFDFSVMVKKLSDTAPTVEFVFMSLVNELIESVDGGLLIEKLWLFTGNGGGVSSVDLLAFSDSVDRSKLSDGDIFVELAEVVVTITSKVK